LYNLVTVSILQMLSCPSCFLWCYTLLVCTEGVDVIINTENGLPAQYDHKGCIVVAAMELFYLTQAFGLYHLK